jgi:hypothetical protein
VHTITFLHSFHTAVPKALALSEILKRDGLAVEKGQQCNSCLAPQHLSTMPFEDSTFAIVMLPSNKHAQAVNDTSHSFFVNFMSWPSFLHQKSWYPS